MIGVTNTKKNRRRTSSLPTEYHQSVMSQEVLSALQLRDGGVYVDATLGGGGHTKLLLDSNDTIKVYGFDRDGDAVSYCSSSLSNYSSRLKIFNDNFVNFRSRLALERITQLDGVLFDLGVSRHQLATSCRGLSFDLDGDLDMRMNQSDELTAAEIVNKYPLEKIAQIIRDFGEEKEAYRIAKGIENHRRYSPIKTTYDLGEIIDKSTKSPYKIKAKARVFQAFRIYLNGELEVLKSALYDAIEMVNTGGRIVVLSYHSLEDRLVKQLFIEKAKDCICPHNFPKCVCDNKASIKIITKKPITPAPEEIAANRSAKSAKMRVAEGL